MSAANTVEIVEVGPRDGYQAIAPFIPTADKIEYIRRLTNAGIRRIEVGSFVSAEAVPQLRDTAEVLAACNQLDALDAQVLVPSARRAASAAAAGAKHLVFVLSVSEAHNRNNVRRAPKESVAEYGRIIAETNDEITIRLNLATAFDCPFSGRVTEADTLELLSILVPLKTGIEVCLCDTTGRAEPSQVASLFRAAKSMFPEVASWAMHAHDTYGLGLANTYSAFLEGVRVFDAAIAGLGGCPFAPGATGNVATEDVVWMFERMGVSTGVSIERLVPVAADSVRIAGAAFGGRVRDALLAKAIRGAATEQ